MQNLQKILGLPEKGKAKYKFVSLDKSGKFAKFEQLGEDGKPNGVEKVYNSANLLKAERDGNLVANPDGTISWTFKQDEPVWS